MIRGSVALLGASRAPAFGMAGRGRLECEEVTKDLEAGFGGLFGMELDAHDVVALDDGGEGSTVVCNCGGIRADGGSPGVGVVDESAGGDAGQQTRVGADGVEGVPADVRGFERGVGEGGGEVLAGAAEVGEALSGFGLGGAVVEPLEADADAEEGGCRS